MTAREAYDILSHFWDKYRDEGITVAEAMRYINTAQVQILKHYTYNHLDPTKKSEYSQPRRGLEQTAYDLWSFKELIVQYPNTAVTALIPATDGDLNFTTLRSAFPDDTIRDEQGVIEVRKPEIFHFLNILRWNGSDDYEMSQWTRHNDWAAVRKDALYGPTDTRPRYRVFADKINMSPAGDNELQITLLRMPRHVSLGFPIGPQGVDTVDPELPDTVMYDILARAATIGGINIREPELVTMMTQNEMTQ